MLHAEEALVVPEGPRGMEEASRDMVFRRLEKLFTYRESMQR
jgi:hypothetical protein